MQIRTKILFKHMQFYKAFTTYSDSFSSYCYNGKEKDYESGFHYYGARYYNSELSVWLSTDPMADKYPSLTPYNYCANNPVKLIDPNGMEIFINGEASDKAVEHLQNKMKNIKISRADDGKLSVSGKAKSFVEKEFCRAIEDNKIKVTIEANEYNQVNSDLGGAFMGNYLSEDGSIITNQFVNVQSLSDYDIKVGDDKPGGYLLHEVMEAFYGGEIAIQKGLKEVKPAYADKYTGKLQPDNPTYRQAHTMANKISIGDYTPEVKTGVLPTYMGKINRFGRRFPVFTVQERDYETGKGFRRR